MAIRVRRNAKDSHHAHASYGSDYSRPHLLIGLVVHQINFFIIFGEKKCVFERRSAGRMREMRNEKVSDESMTCHCRVEIIWCGY